MNEGQGTLVPWWLAAGQSAPSWLATEVGVRSLIDLLPPREYQGLLDIRVAGNNMLCGVTYGTSSQLKIYNLRPPFRLTLPGAVNVYASKIDAGAVAWGRCTAQPVSSGFRSFARSFSDVAGQAPDSAVRAIAVNAANLVVAGVAVALAAGESIDIITPTSLVSGAVIFEHEI